MRRSNHLWWTFAHEWGISTAKTQWEEVESLGAYKYIVESKPDPSTKQLWDLEQAVISLSLIFFAYEMGLRILSIL